MEDAPSLKLKILVVDDEKDVLNMLSAFFTNKGYDLFTAPNGETAFDILEKKHPDVVLLDMRMPNIDGVQVLSHIKAHYFDIKVIVLTTFDAEYAKKVEELGADAFLSKPFSVTALSDIIEYIVTKQALPQKEEVVKLMGNRKVLAKAKLLFFEPNNASYGDKADYLSKSKQCGGKYSSQAAYGKEELLQKLATFRPDIVVGDIKLLGPEKDLIAQIMHSRTPPKDIVAYGKRSHTDFYKLSRLIRRSAIEHGLFETHEKELWDASPPPGMDPSSERPPLERLEETVIAVIAKHLDKSPDEITVHSHLINNLGADSLDILELTIGLEDVFIFEISDRMAKKLLRVKDITKYIKENVYK